ncbi:MAG: DUF3096 domain-containing protein [Nanoarchaeota archaeon]
MVLLTFTLSAILSIIFGILILIWPRLLNYLVAIYLILIGLIQLLGSYVGLSPLI